MSTVTKGSVFGLLAVAEPNVLVLGGDVADGAAFDEALLVAVEVGAIAEGLRVGEAAAAPLIHVVLLYGDLTFITSMEKLEIANCVAK